jgi:hypothetical protein
LLLEQGFLLGLSGLGIRLKLLVLFLKLALLGVEGALGLGLLTVDVERLLFHAWVAVLGLSGRLQALHVLLGCHRTSHHWGLLHHWSHLRWHRGCGDRGILDYWRSYLRWHRGCGDWGLLDYWRSYLRWHRGCGDWGLVGYW